MPAWISNKIKNFDRVIISFEREREKELALCKNGFRTPKRLKNCRDLKEKIKELKKKRGGYWGLYNKKYKHC